MSSKSDKWFSTLKAVPYSYHWRIIAALVTLSLLSGSWVCIRQTDIRFYHDNKGFLSTQLVSKCRTIRYLRHTNAKPNSDKSAPRLWSSPVSTVNFFMISILTTNPSCICVYRKHRAFKKQELCWLVRQSAYGSANFALIHVCLQIDKCKIESSR